MPVRNNSRQDLFDVAGLVFACPISLDNPENCPLHKFRTLSGRDKVNWLFSRTRKDIAEITKFHAECIAKRQPNISRAPANGPVSNYINEELQD